METRLFISYRSECALLPDLLHRRVRLNLQQEVNLMKQTYLRGDMALYIRLAKEDESEGPSESVTNQQSL